MVCAKYWGGIEAHSLSEPIRSLPQGCGWCIKCNRAIMIVHCNRIGDWSAGHDSIPYKGERELGPLGVITSAPTAHIKTPVTAILG